jgi:ATP-dependent exoDNAse (exonuclease V) beta subunit
MNATLTSDQRRAIEGRGVVFVSAGAGTGKTTVLVERVALAIEGGLDPERLLVVTFTQRAADQLVARVRARLAAAGEDLARLAERAEISTIHGFCARLLREHAFAAGVDPAFRVLDEASARIVAAEAFDRALERAVDEEPDESLDLLVAYGGDRLRGMLTTAHERLRATGRGLAPPGPHAPDLAASLAAAAAEADATVALLEGADGRRAAENLERAGQLRTLCRAGGDPVLLVDLDSVKLRYPPAGTEGYEAGRVALARDALESVAARQHTRLVELLARFDEAYTAAKDAEGALDFADLELRARDLLRRDDAVRTAVRERFRHVLVDEFQDTNRLQCDLVDLVAAPDAEQFYVGDEFQSIYRFRHADVGVFLERRQAAPEHVALRDNYRSRGGVLAVVNGLFEEVFGDDYRALEPSKRFEGPEFEDPVELCVALAGDAGVEAARETEATLVAERVQAVLAAGEHRAGDVVVLLRAATDAELYEDALRAAGLETHRTVGGGYYGRQQVVDLLAYLRLLRNRYDDRALLTVLASPLVGVSNDGLWQIRRAARAGIFHGIERMLPSELGERDLNLVRAFRQRYDRLVAASAELGLEALLERIVADHDYDLACLAQRDGRRRYANVRKLVRLAREYEALRGPDLAGFLAFADAQAAAGAREGEAPTIEEEGGDAVRLMTIHGAKGLEFPVVVVADCGRAMPRIKEDIIALPDGRFAFRVPDTVGRLHDPSAYETVWAAEQEADDAELRRVIYVAMTRAADRLIISGVVGRDDSPLRFILDGLGVDPEAIDSNEPRTHDLEGGGRVLVHVRRVGEEPPAAAPEEPPAGPEQLDLFTAAEVAPPAEETQPLAELAPLAPLPAAPRHVPGRLSFTAVALHERCPHRYFAERILGLSPVDRAAGNGSGGLAARDIGDAVHVLLEQGADASLEGRYPVPPTAEELDLVRSFVDRFESSDLAARVAALAGLRRELAFAFVEDGVVFRGRFDAFGYEPDGTAVVVDYKTTALLGRSPTEVVADEYRLQLAVYALAVLRAGAPAVEVVFAFLESADAAHAERFTAADEPGLAGEIHEAVERLRVSDFAPRPGPVCADCGALDRTCAGPRLLDRQP